MEYNFREVEKKWQDHWAKNKTFKTENNTDKPKYYVLDMFPYPSGAGLHVGHPLGYIASDIFARYKRLKGFNVLHPMGYDSFGLPAEQYAIQTGQHPSKTTLINIDGCLDDEGKIKKEFVNADGSIKKEALNNENEIIKGYRKQLDKIGFSFDWDREVRTSDPSYYKWTQWIFIQLFNSWYNNKSNKAEKISTLISEFEINGNATIKAACEETKTFTAADWKGFSEKEKSDILLNYRLAFLSDTMVNWCPQLGTVLANEEVKDGVSERGGYPVERKLMKQWSLRITAYAERLLNDLDELDWTDSIKEAQRNWIGKSVGTSLKFSLSPSPSPQERSVVAEPDCEYSQQFYTTDGQMWNLLFDKAKSMRKNPTPAESALWQAVRANGAGYKIRRQHIIDRFIVDFVCLSKKLIIEVDGDIHDFQKQEDDERTELLNRKGFKVIRYKNEIVLGNIDVVVNSIINELNNITVDYPNEESEIKIVEEENEQYTISPSPEERGSGGEVIEVFTTRPDTIFGVSFVTLAPEHELVAQITTAEQKQAVEEYIAFAKNRSERERMADVKKITGVFTGAYVIHPFTGKQVPIWVGDYVLAGYGTGAVMAVPAHDSRDYAFATHFGIEKKVIIQPPVDWDFADKSYDEKEGKLVNSDFLNGLEVKAAIKKAIAVIEEKGLGKGKTNFRLRDAIFGRQRYWGEPIPVYYKHLSPTLSSGEGETIPCVVDEADLPIMLPEVDKYLPTETGEPPLARAKDWKYKGLYEFEYSTMPGWAGSSWYFLRYMDAHNDKTFVSKDAATYWQNVDLYMGGAEHATGHLLYVRFWTKFLYDLGLITVTEPAKKLINQGMIQGRSNFVYRAAPKMELIGWKENGDKDPNAFSIKHPGDYLNRNPIFVSKNLMDLYIEGDLGAEKRIKESLKAIDEIIIKNVGRHNSTLDIHKTKMQLHVDVNIVNNDILDQEAFKNWREEYKNAIFITEENGDYICGSEVEKMSKSKWNVVSPDAMVEQYGADCLRLYEMFLGPLELSKPWNTNGISGVSSFMRKLWRLYHSPEWNNTPLLWRGAGGEVISNEPPTQPELKTLHKTIKKITEDIERFSFNTSVSNFMICVNELTEQKCNKRDVLEPLAIIIAPYAPHIAEELWRLLGHTESITYATFPICNESYLVESSFNYPISFNGKTRFFQEYDRSLTKEEVEKEVLTLEQTQKYLEGKAPKKIIVVQNKIVNIVV